ncbi:unnamed protein product [Laminaria digitata]
MAKSKGTKRGRKKKRVAAHIKDAAEKRAASAFSGNSGEDQRAQLLASPLGVGRPKRPREPGQLRSASYTAAADDPGRKERERAEAINYLQAWMSMKKAKEEADAGGVAASVAGLWKFSKNTQAWLLRHLFSEDQIDEGSFGTLCLYLEGLKGSGRERVLAEAQVVIDKHGPDEGEEQTAAAREAAAPAAAAAGAEVEEVNETVADEPAQVAPSGYNSDSSEEGEEGSGETTARDIKGGAKIAEVSPPGVAPTAEAGGESDSRSSSDSDSSSDDSGEDAVEEKGEGGVVEVLAPAGKKPRKKARSALTGDSKAEAKARTAMVAYERALQVAELLS